MPSQHRRRSVKTELNMPLKKIINEVSSAIYSLPWYVARDEGFFHDEGLDLEFINARQGTPKNASENTRLVNPIVGHSPFEDGHVNLFRACEEGNVRRTVDLSRKTVNGCDVRITSLQPSRPVHAVIVAPNSPIDRPAQLADVPVGVNFFAGSHFAGIRLLEGFVGRGRVRLQHFGGPASRLDAVLAGEVPAAVLMEPYIALAEKLGASVLAQGHFVVTDVVRDDLPQQDLQALYRALNRASDFLNASSDNKRKYISYLIDDIPADYRWGRPEVSDFHLPPLRFGHTLPYPKREFDRSLEILEQYDLLSPGVSFAKVVDNGALAAVAH
jgi:NitT/TauT family transport system substrate-binding protein